MVSSYKCYTLCSKSRLLGFTEFKFEAQENNPPTIFENFRKSSEVVEIVGGLRKFFITFLSDTCGLKIRFKNFDL